MANSDSNPLTNKSDFEMRAWLVVTDENSGVPLYGHKYMSLSNHFTAMNIKRLFKKSLNLASVLRLSPS